jgi:hypothetical protein
MAKSKTKVTTKTQIEHGAAEHPTHIADKAKNEARRNLSFLRVPYKPAEVFGFPYSSEPFLGKGQQWLIDQGKFVKVNPFQWTDHLNALLKNRSKEFYNRDKDRRRTQRKIKPLSQLVVTLAPWTSAFIYIALKHKGKRGRQLVSDYVKAAMRMTIKIAKARTLNEAHGISNHYDTDDIHINLFLCCVTKDRERIGEIRLRTAGKAAVGYNRQLSIGARTDLNFARNATSLRKYRERAEKAKLGKRIALLPLDIEIAQAIDVLASQRFGHSPIFQHAMRAYTLFVTDRVVMTMSDKAIEKRIKADQAEIGRREEQKACRLEVQKSLRETISRDTLESPEEIISRGDLEM